MKSNYTANQRFNGVETQLADCAVCMIHTYIAHDDFQNDFLRYPDKRDNVLAPYIEAYLDGQDREQRAIGKDIPHYNKMLSDFSQSILMMYAYEVDFKNTLDKISAYNKQFRKFFPDIAQARIIFIQYAKVFYETRRKRQ